MGMKRITSEWDLEDLLHPVSEDSFSHVDLVFSFDADAHGNTFNGPSMVGGALGGSQIWSQSPTPKNSGISANLESQSSIGAGSPTSSFKLKGGDNQTLGGTSGSESDEESQETEVGPSEQSTKVVDVKRMRRMVSNRESARRSRKRKQAHLADLELQVDQLRGENASLYKQLTDANQQFSDAATDNRVLKSGVEALRVKVKMAEDMVARGSLTCSLDHLLQNHIASAQLSSTRNLCRASEVPPIVDVQGDEDFSIDPLDVGQFHNLGVENNELKNGNTRTRVSQGLQLQGVAELEHLTSWADIWP